MRRALLAVGLAGSLIAAPAALAHQGNPNMTSVVRFVDPKVPGVHLQVLGGGDQFELRNQSGQEIVVYGYGGDELARLLASGVVQENRNSPAYYLDQDYYGTVSVPAHATATARPDWITVANDGRFQWHDHRMHYMGTGTPPGIKDASKRQKYADYTVPLRIGTQQGAIHGTIWWSPIHQTGPPIAAILALVLVVLGGAGLVVVARRRRGAGAPAPAAEAPSEREAW